MSSKIAFIVWRQRTDGSPDLYLADVPGGTLRLLASDLDISYFALSPDEQRVACVVISRAEKFSRLRLIETDGSLRSLFQTSFVAGLAWSPDNERLGVLIERRGGTDLLIAQADGSGVQRIASGCHDFGWSPDGKRLAVWGNQEGEGFFIIDADGSNAQQILDHELIVFQPNWTPDGEQIIFVGMSDEYGEDVGLFAVKTDGTDLRRITNLDSTLGFAVGFALSPDARQIAFIGQASASAKAGYTLWVVDVDGRDLRALANEPYRDYRLLETPRWLPDGEHLIFVALNEEHAAHLYLIKADGSERRCLTEALDTRDARLHLGWMSYAHTVPFMQRSEQFSPVRQPLPWAGLIREELLGCGLLLLSVVLLLIIIAIGFRMEPPGVYVFCAVLLLLGLPSLYRYWRSPTEDDSSPLSVITAFYAIMLPLMAFFVAFHHLFGDDDVRGVLGFFGGLGLVGGLVIAVERDAKARRRRLQRQRQTPLEAEPFIKDEGPEEE